MSGAHPEPLSLKEVTEVLVKHFGFHEGFYDLSFEIRIAVGRFGPTPEEALPGAQYGIGGVSILRSKALGPHSVDAAVVNPPPKATRTKKKKT